MEVGLEGMLKVSGVGGIEVMEGRVWRAEGLEGSASLREEVMEVLEVKKARERASNPRNA